MKLFGETIEVHAKIQQLAGISGHADKEGLIRWLQGFKKKPERVFVVHGEANVCDAFTQCLKDEYGYDAVAPYSGTSFDLLDNSCVVESAPIRKSKKAAARKANSVFERLVAAGRRLLVVIQHNEGGANKDLAKFADQINNLCDKWDR